MNWRERQALPGPRARWFFASVVPQLVYKDTGEAADFKDLKPGREFAWKWPKKGDGHTLRRYDQGGRRIERTARPAKLEDFSIVDHPAAA